MASVHRLMVGLPLALLVLPTVADAETHTSVAVMCVSTPAKCPNYNQPNADSSGASFVNELLQSNPLGLVVSLQDTTPDTNGMNGTDSFVNDIDFDDPNISGTKFPTADDYSKYDQVGEAIAYYQGHGNTVNKPVPDQICTSEAQCIYPPSGTAFGATGFGTCVQSPSSWQQYGSGYGVCMYVDTRGPIVCGENDQNGGLVQINNSPGGTGYVALGENPTNGAWRGAATNGGATVAIMKMSNGMMTFFPTSEWWTLFAGLHQFDSVAVSWGDSEDSPGFGFAVAAPYKTNPNQQVQSGYVNAISSVTDGTGCPGTSWGGGFNGCGCHVAMTVGGSNSSATSATFHEWYTNQSTPYGTTGITVDDSSQNGASNWYFSMVCNYNNGAYPWTGGDAY